MKLYVKRAISTILALSIIIISIFCFPLSVNASSSGIHPDPDKPLGNILFEGAKYAVFYIISQIGAVADGDFFNFMQNKATWNDYWNGDNITEITDDDGNVVSYNFSEELVAYIKQCLDEYAAENQPFFVKSTYKANQIPASVFTSKTAYQTFIEYSKSHYMFFLRFNGNGFNVYDFTPEFKEGGGFYNAWRYVTADACNKFLSVDSDWNTWKSKPCYYDYYEFKQNADGDMVLDTVHEKISYFTENGGGIDVTPGRTDFRPSYSNICFLVTQDGGNIRVYQSISDLKNYSVGQRKVYYTNNYYDYVPEDLTVSIDELQKTIEDMQDIIDKLLDQITNNTSESEIEELLKQILDELRKNPGTGGDGSGSGGGDINVDIDLSTTNSLLSKILAKVTQIFDKISETAGQSMTDVVNSIHELGAMLKKYLVTITGDLDDIKEKLEQMTEEEFEEKTDSLLNDTKESFSEIGEVAKRKFPFSLPNDMRILIERISVPPAETVSVYSDDTSGISLYSDHGGGGLTDGKPNPPGGGGASRPAPGGLAHIEQGSVGNSFGISSNGAPVIRCPIVIKRLDIDCSIVIDLSEFDKVATLARVLLTLLFVYGLYNLTFKVMGLWGDLVE